MESCRICRNSAPLSGAKPEMLCMIPSRVASGNLMPEQSTVNPLLQQRFPVPFDAFEAEQVEPAIGELLAGMNGRVQRLSASADQRTYENVLLVLDRLTEPLDYAMSVVRHLES